MTRTTKFVRLTWLDHTPTLGGQAPVGLIFVTVQRAQTAGLQASYHICVTIRRILQVHSEPEAEGRSPMTQIFVTPMTIIFEQIDLELPNWHDNRPRLDEAWQ